MSQAFSSELSKFIDQLNSEFLTLHQKKEDLFWEAKMGLGANAAESQTKLSKAEIEAQQFNQNAETLKQLKQLAGASNGSTTEEDKKALQGWINFFSANAIDDEKAKALATEIIEMEGALQTARGGMDLGYIDPANGQHVVASTNMLSNMMKIEKDEALRKAGFEGLRTIEPFVLDKGFLEIVKKRNELGRALGYEDYYDMKVQRTEGFSKKRLFNLLDDLEVKTRESAQRAVNEMVAKHGETARKPWNFGYLMSGDLAAKEDAYLQFRDSLEYWVRSFSAMNIKFRGATLTLDLIDRKGKYENGFMHGPQPAWFNKGQWNPARINFTANAIPNKVGAGYRALETFFHEGGHAAHFSNIQMNAPCFAQEFAPTSVAYAETQSMFCDSVLSDADWRTRYAKNAKGEAFPMELIEEGIRLTQPFKSMFVRGMLAVCYVEKYLYEMSESELTPENVLTMIRDVERRMTFLEAGSRPILAVPHLLAGESSAYYHGYVLAEMAVHQTRDYFFTKYGHIIDNPNVGPELAAGYWAPGNSVSFMDLVERVTGKPFSADAIVADANMTVDEAIAEARKLKENLKNIPEYTGKNELDAAVSIIHGNEHITRFTTHDEFEAANKAFKQWVESNYPSEN
jgi:oligoendopeptidase F